jgi:hypothetical protein
MQQTELERLLNGIIQSHDALRRYLHYITHVFLYH